MKKHILILLAVASLAGAQLFTNTISITYNQQQRDNITDAWTMDQFLRTNGYPPYTVATNGRTLLQFFADQAGVSLETDAIKSYETLEARFLTALRAAPLTNRLAAIKAARALLP